MKLVWAVTFPLRRTVFYQELTSWLYVLESRRREGKWQAPISWTCGSADRKILQKRIKAYQQHFVLPSDGYTNFLSALCYLMFPYALSNNLAKRCLREPKQKGFAIVLPRPTSCVWKNKHPVLQHGKHFFQHHFISCKLNLFSPKVIFMQSSVSCYFVFPEMFECWVGKQTQRVRSQRNIPTRAEHSNFLFPYKMKIAYFYFCGI